VTFTDRKALLKGESGRVPSATTKAITPPTFPSIAPQRRKSLAAICRPAISPQIARGEGRLYRLGGRCRPAIVNPAPLVAASFQLVRELRQPLQPSLLPTAAYHVPPGRQKSPSRGLSPWGVMVVLNMSGRNSNAFSSFSRSRLADPASPVAASFQLVRELRQPLQPSLLPTAACHVPPGRQKSPSRGLSPWGVMVVLGS
jgi:hypothetical protein